MAYTYTQPDFLKDNDVNSVYNRMKANMPDTEYTNEASMFWDYTRPVAMEKAEMVELQLNETIKVGFPHWAYGEYLLLHAEMAGVTKKEAVAATATVKVTGLQGAALVEGQLLATPAIDDQSSIIFKTKTALQLDSSGIGYVEVEAVMAGVTGNVAANTITLMVLPAAGITSIKNEQAASGGTEEESEDSLIERILEARRTTPMSGSVSDYKLWGMEVAGVGKVYVIPEWQGSGTGTVKMIIVDANGQPANATLIQAVQDYIAPEDGTGKAPIGAIVTVEAPTGLILNYEFSMQLKEGYNKESVLEAIKEYFTEYYTTVGVAGVVKYSQIAARIASVDGVDDFSGLTINGGTANIQLAEDEYAATGTVTVT